MHPFVGRRLPRLNDQPFLSGRATFVADLQRPGLGHVAVVRSKVSHGVVRGVNLDGPAPPGATLLGPEAFADLHGLPVVWRLGEQRQLESPAYGTHVRYVGQPLALIVADSEVAAIDVLERVIVDIDRLPAVVDAIEALAPGAPTLYPVTNVLTDFAVGDDRDDVATVLADCDHVIAASFRAGRLAGAPMEPRGILAEPDGERIVIHTSTQAPHAVRDALAAATGWPLERIRVIAPAVGGGFGVKDHLYEDELMVIVAAMRLQRPLRWIESRGESLTVTAQARDERYDVEIGATRDGRLRALHVRAVRNAGAQFAIFGAGPLFAALGMMPGPYGWEAYRGEGRAVATNSVSTAAYRGFGQTQAAFVRERSVDLVARALGCDPVELRLANVIASTQQPFTTRTFITYDSGDYGRTIERARDEAATWPAAADDRRRRGVGYCTYVQLAGVGPSTVNEMIGLTIGGYETATVRMAHDGCVQVLSGITPHGQGQETTFAQLVADRLGVAPAAVQLRHSDTDHTPYSAYGTAASRSVAVGGGAAVEAAGRLAAKLRAIAAEMLEANPADIELADGRARVRGGGGEVTIVAVAARAWQGFRLPDGVPPGLDETVTYDPVSATFSYGTHVCRVAIDDATGQVEIERYAVVHDCGTIVNPTIVEGQIHGGIAQGAAAALLEEVAFDHAGQPLTTNFADYLVPDATFLPDIAIDHLEIPSPYTPGGMKGVGEGGTNGSFACVANAVAAALPEIAEHIVQTPLSPERIWRLLDERAGRTRHTPETQAP